MNSIFHRASIRSFVNKEVEPENVEMLLRAAMAAPSAGNQQPWEFYVITCRDTMKQLAACSPYAGCAGQAPLVIAACCRTGVMHPEYAPIDLSAATENLLLEADDLGLGAVWLGIAPLRDRMDKVKAILNLPHGLEAFALIACGYPEREGRPGDRYDRTRVHYVD